MPSKLQSKYIDDDSSGPDEVLKEYKYCDLKARNSIRILNLKPAKRRKGSQPQPEVVCELLEENLDNLNSKYEALSWAWGTPESDPFTEKIRIATKGEEDFFFVVPPNLAAALRALRYPQYSRKLWVDAICINQKHTDEKNKQVPMMSRIYRGAEKVCIWLGPADSDSKMALDFINNEVLKLQNFDELCDDPHASPKWAAMLNLMKRSWFSRRWVVQEIALAHDAMIYCGRDSLPWKDFADAVQLFVEVETATRRLSEVMKKDPTFYHVPGWFEYVSALGASLLVDATGTIFRTSKDESRSPLLSLEYLVSFLSVFEVSEPRDAIYSLLAVAKDANPIPVIHAPTKSSVPAEASLEGLGRNLIRIPYKVDYQKDVVDIFKDFIQFSIRQSQKSDPTRALDIICRPWAPMPKRKKSSTNTAVGASRILPEETMPSWISKLKGAAYAMFPHTNGEVKMGRKNADPLVGLPSQSQRNYNAAETKAINMSQLYFKKRDNYYSMFVTGFVVERVQKVEVASQSGNIPEEWISLARWDTTVDPPEEFWRTLVADRGRMGKNPPTYYARACKESISKGDLVCILFGCSVPVILRRRRKTNFEEEQKADDQGFIKAAIWIQRHWRSKISIRNPGNSHVPSINRDNAFVGVGNKSPAVEDGYRSDPLSPTSTNEEFVQQNTKKLKPKPKPKPHLKISPETGREPSGILTPRTADEQKRYYYEFVGECYVHGMMDGEAIKHQNTEFLKEMVFELR